MKFVVEYNPHGIAFADSQVETHVRLMIENYQLLKKYEGDAFMGCHQIYGQDLVITAWRLAIKEGLIDCSEVEFRCGEFTYQANSKGRFPDWKGYPDIHCDLLCRLLK